MLERYMSAMIDLTSEPTDIDRLSIRSRPTGMPLMHQRWDHLLFLHWPIEPQLLRSRIPSNLEIDTFEGQAWIGVTPFTMANVRPVLAPALPGISSAHELNVRTYVVQDGVPGVWFFSLDASNSLAVFLARLGFSLPYYRASMSLTRDEDGTIRYSSNRDHADAPAAAFKARWRPERGRSSPGDSMTESPAAGVQLAAPGTLEFYLVERYCLYTVRRGKVMQARIHHSPWELQEADLLELQSTMIASHGFPEPTEEPLVHAQAAALDVDIWPLKSVEG